MGIEYKASPDKDLYDEVIDILQSLDDDSSSMAASEEATRA